MRSGYAWAFMWDPLWNKIPVGTAAKSAQFPVAFA